MRITDKNQILHKQEKSANFLLMRHFVPPFPSFSSSFRFRHFRYVYAWSEMTRRKRKDNDPVIPVNPTANITGKHLLIVKLDDLVLENFKYN